MRTFTLITLLLLTSCSLFKKKGEWGKNAWYPVKGERIKNAFVKNITSAHVYAPIAGATVIKVMAWDNKISKWENKDRSIFNEQTEADNWSDNFNEIQKYEMYLSILLTPSNNEDGTAGNYLLNKAKGGLLVSVASTGSRSSQHWLRAQTERRRPNNKDNNSLPSGHATEAASRRVLIDRMIATTDYHPNVKTGVSALNTGMSMAVMWARVEGKRHYPTDVLLGYSLGSFVSGFIYDALINLDPDTSVGVFPASGGGGANVTVNF